MARAASAARTAPARRAAPARQRPRPAPAKPAPTRRARPRQSTGQHMRAVVVGAPMGLMDRLLRGQGWVVCIGALLAGIVYLNVTLLEVNRDIAAMSSQAEQLNRENSALRDKIAKKGTSEEIQKLAQSAGFVLPAPKDVRYLTADPANDAKLAAQVASGAPVVGTTEAVADSTGVTEEAAEATGTVQPEVSEAPASDEPVAALPEPQAEGPG